jgi:hypothetical protein
MIATTASASTTDFICVPETSSCEAAHSRSLHERRAADLLTKAVELAVMAPSSHNTQPWSFRLQWDGLEVMLDRSRVLPVTDPAAREMIISCGAALQNIPIALRHWGYWVDCRSHMVHAVWQM